MFVMSPVWPSMFEETLETSQQGCFSTSGYPLSSPFLQGTVTIPGMLGVLPIERPCDVETGEFSKKASLVYHYGYSSPATNLKLYKTAVTAMAKMFKERCQASPKSE